MKRRGKSRRSGADQEDVDVQRRSLESFKIPDNGPRFSDFATRRTAQRLQAERANSGIRLEGTQEFLKLSKRFFCL
jgi:hypothetical protein